jgi:hypothetical protein
MGVQRFLKPIGDGSIPEQHSMTRAKGAVVDPRTRIRR